MKQKKKIKHTDREVVAQAQFRTGAGPIPIRRKDPRWRRRNARLEEKRTASEE